MKYTILGERCSGTNWLQRLIDDNFNCELTWLNGWKHFFAYDGYDERVLSNKDVIFLCIVRNPIDYLMSFYNNPHHQSKDRIQNIESFLLNEFYSVWNDTDEILQDRKFDGNRYKNIFELRSLKCKYVLDTMPTLTSMYHFIRYEDLKKNSVGILDDIKNKFGLINKNKEYYIEKGYVHQNKVHSNLKCKENYLINDITKRIINENLDFEIEQKMGYLL